jgi:hypothetical protein
LLIASGAQNERGEKSVFGAPLLWREPFDLASRNLYLGPGGESMKPDLSKLTFIEEKASAASAKFRVRDGSGREWVVKVSPDAKSEVAASRLVWAVGYFTDVSYFVESAQIEGKGVVENSRFEARPKGFKRLEEWLWDENPFVGSNELQGLKVLLAMLDNWNLKNENNKIIFVREDEGGTSELRYIVSDFDLQLDKSGDSPSIWHSRSGTRINVRFIERVKNNLVEFGYAGKHKERMTQVTIQQAKWIGRLLARLSDQQLRDALRAGNYSVEQIEVLKDILRSRITELTALN